MVRVFWPGLLSIIGGTPLFGLAWYFLTAPGPATPSIESGGPPVFLIIAFGAGFVGIFLLAFSIALFVDTAHHRIWGLIVALLYALGYLIVQFGVVAYSADQLTSLLGVAALIAYGLGFVGGIWGFLWKTPWTSLRAAKALAGPAGRVFAGGLVSSVSWAIGGATITLVIPVVLVLGPLLLHAASGKRRIVAAILLGVSLATSLLLVLRMLYLYETYGGLAGDDRIVPALAGSVIGSVLAGSGAVQLIKQRHLIH